MKIVMTGASGGVAQMLRPILRERHELILSDRADAPGPMDANETWQHADLTDREAMGTLLKGADGLIHLGGFSVEGDWPTIRDANIEGLYNTLDACRTEGVPRVIFASSNHAVGFYPRARRIGINEPVRPDGFYGVSKAFGEAMCSMFADKHGLRVMSIRIGNIGYVPMDKRRMSIWQHPEDLAQLIEIGLTHPDIHHAIVYGASSNERAWWDNGTAYGLGYVPKHKSEDHRDHALAEQAKLPADPLGDKYQGGTFCSDGFAGDEERTYNARWPST